LKLSFAARTLGAGEAYRGPDDASSSTVRFVYVDADDQLAGEKIYYDRGTVLRQLGVFHEPRSVMGQICILATHAMTIARAFARKLLRR
jgi:hypothetical protein